MYFRCGFSWFEWTPVLLGLPSRPSFFSPWVDGYGRGRPNDIGRRWPDWVAGLWRLNNCTVYDGVYRRHLQYIAGLRLHARRKYRRGVVIRSAGTMSLPGASASSPSSCRSKKNRLRVCVMFVWVPSTILKTFYSSFSYRRSPAGINYWQACP